MKVSESKELLRSRKIVVALQLLSHVWLFVTPRTAARHVSLSTVFLSLLRLMSIESPGHPTVSSSVAPFSSCPQSFPASGYFPVSQLFTSSGRSISTSASATVFSTNIQGWFPLWLTGLIFLSKGDGHHIGNNIKGMKVCYENPLKF